MSFKEKFKSIIGIDEEEYEYEEYEEYEEEEEEAVEEEIIEAEIKVVQEPKIIKPEPVKPILKTITNNKPSQSNQASQMTQSNQATNNQNQINPMVNKEKSVITPLNKETNKQMNEKTPNKVIIREPNEYSDAQDIADCLKDNFPVFINLQRLEKSQAKRVVDFLSGTIYAIDGDIKRVGTNLFLCTPRTVETEGQVSLQELQLEIGE